MVRGDVGRRAWRERLARFHLAGGTVAAFCRREGVSTASFYAWRRRLADHESTMATTSSPLKAPTPTSHPTPPGFHPVRLTSLGDAAISAVLPGGMRLEIAAQGDNLRLAIETLARLDRQGGVTC